MSDLTDKMTQIIGMDNADHILRAFDEEGPRREIARETVRGLDGISRQSLALIELSHVVQEIKAVVCPLKKEHDAVMRGEMAPCRHMQVMETKMWRFIAASFSVPVLVGVILFILKKL